MAELMGEAPRITAWSQR